MYINLNSNILYFCCCLVESTHPVRHKQAQWLLSEILTRRNEDHVSGKLRPTIRVSLSGPPGAGKSTLIEKLGLHLLELGFKVAVLVSCGAGYEHTLKECFN